MTTAMSRKNIPTWQRRKDILKASESFSGETWQLSPEERPSIKHQTLRLKKRLKKKNKRTKRKRFKHITSDTSICHFDLSSSVIQKRPKRQTRPDPCKSSSQSLAKAVPSSKAWADSTQTQKSSYQERHAHVLRHEAAGCERPASILTCSGASEGLSGSCTASKSQVMSRPCPYPNIWNIRNIRRNIRRNITPSLALPKSYATAEFTTLGSSEGGARGMGTKSPAARAASALQILRST